MKMIRVFLIGGGWRAETFPNTYGRFLSAASEGGRARILIVVAEEPGADAHEHFLRFSSAFETIGLNPEDAFETIVTATDPLSRQKIAAVRPTGVFVCGGLTPAYFDALCADRGWLDYLLENEIPYCGFSAGASVAAETAIVGGWRRKIGDLVVGAANENAGEDLDLLDVRRGLGLVDPAIDVHATEWGTLSRLVHAVDAGLAGIGAAIDENTMLECSEHLWSVHGAGSVYLIRRAENRSVVDIFPAGTRISLSE